MGQAVESRQPGHGLDGRPPPCGGELLPELAHDGSRVAAWVAPDEAEEAARQVVGVLGYPVAGHEHEELLWQGGSHD